MNVNTSRCGQTEPGKDELSMLRATLADMAKRLEAAERDAARYRWLRDKAWSMPAIAQQELPAVAIFSGSGRRCKDVSGEEMDAAIDAAIDATQEGEG